MALSPAYVGKEAATNLWRNRLMTAAAILTVAVSLALVGSALLLKQGASKATELWQNGVQTIVWVKPSAGPAQTNALGTQLHQSPYVKSCIYRDQAFDYNEAKIVLPDVYKRQARRIGRTIPLVHSSQDLGAAAALRWKCQINESAKSPAFWNVHPELGHNEVAGWGLNGDATRQLITLVNLRHDAEHPQVLSLIHI